MSCSERSHCNRELLKELRAAWLHAPHTFYALLLPMEGPTSGEAWRASLRTTGAQADGKAPPGLVLVRDLFPGAQQTSSSAFPSQPCFCRAGNDMSTSTQEDNPAGALASSQGGSQQLPDYRLLPCGVQPGMPFEQAASLHLPRQPQSAPTAARSLVQLA